MASEYLSTSRNFSLDHEPSEEGGLQLDKFLAILKRRMLLVAGITVLGASAAIAQSFAEDPIYLSEFELLTPPVTLETEIISTINPEALSNKSDAVGIGVLDETKIKILTSPRVMEPVVEELRKSYPNINYQRLKRSLIITPNDDGQTLTVKYLGSDPEKVIKVLDVVSEAFLRYSLEDRQSDIYRGVDFVDEQLPAVRSRVNELEGELEGLRQASNLIDPLLQGQQLSGQVAQFTSEQLELRVEIEQTEQLYSDLQQELSRGGELAAASALSNSPRYQALLNQLLEVDSQLADDLTLYLEDSPEIDVIEERRANIRPLLRLEGQRVQEEVGSIIRELRARDQALSDSISTLNERIKQLSSVARDYNTIQRDLDIASANLNEFLTKREALRIDAAQRETPWEILTPHEYPSLSETNVGLNLLLGGLVGLFLGSALALVIDVASNKVYTIKELKQTTRTPVLGAIPHDIGIAHGKAAVRLADGERYSPYKDSYLQGQSRHFLEAFKRLATNVKLNSVDSHIGSLVVSSALPNEGKSSISFFLASTSASMGRRTLLVDTDLRHPTLHHLCGVANDVGLFDYLSGGASLDESLFDLSIDENLFFMPAGSVPADPTRLLSSKKMAELYEQVYKMFDLVIFDTPPLLGFSDAFLIAKQTQGLLLTARLGQVKHAQLEAVLDELYVSKVSTIGLVANDVSEEEGITKDYYQHYYEDFVPLEPSRLADSNGNTSMNGNGKSEKEPPWKKPFEGILKKP